MDLVQKKTESIPIFTIIIPVMHSLEDLERCVSSLDDLDYLRERFHVVLVDCHVVLGLKQFFIENLTKHEFYITTLCLPERSTVKPSWLIESRLNEARNYAIQRIPGRYYVFTEDDCTFETDWLQKFEAALTDEVGALGGPDILPEGMGWFPRTLDCILNSYMGTAGMRRGDGRRENQYYPRKENMVIPACVLDRVGSFIDERPIGGEMEMVNRIREAGFKIKFLSNNHVWHRRVTTIRNFFRLTAYMAYEKVRIMREQHTFIKSTHFFVLLAIIAGTFVGLSSLVSSHARILLLALVGAYFVALLSTAIKSAIHTRSASVGLGVLVLMPLHHLSLVNGIIKSSFARIKLNETKKEGKFFWKNLC